MIPIDFQSTTRNIESLLVLVKSLDRQKEILLNPKILFLRFCSILRLTSTEANSAWLADLRGVEASNILFISQQTYKDTWRRIAKKLHSDTPTSKAIFSALRLVITEELELREIEIDQDT